MKPAFLVKLQNGRATVTQTHICLPEEPQVLGPDDLIDFELDDRILILKVSDLDIILSANDANDLCLKLRQSSIQKSRPAQSIGFGIGH